MGLSNQEKQALAQQQAIFSQLQAQIAAMNNPKSNPAQDYLSTEALAGADYLKKGEFSKLPRGMFFNFQMPAEQINQYKKYADVNQGGTFGLANNGGRSKATALQGQYLKDKFARDAGQNYQNNISDAATNIRGGLAQAAGASSNNASAVTSALGNLYNSIPRYAPKKPFDFGSTIGGILGAL